jgi:hypothetical protein
MSNIIGLNLNYTCLLQALIKKYEMRTDEWISGYLDRRGETRLRPAAVGRESERLEDRRDLRAEDDTNCDGVARLLAVPSFMNQPGVMFTPEDRVQFHGRAG